MIGVDTNVLIRLYVADDQSQHEAAADFFAERSEASPAYVSLVVFLEFVWALTRTYNYRWKEVHALLDALVVARDVIIEREDVVAEALARAVEDNVGLIDAIIALANADDGCLATVTFDKKAARRLPSMELLA